MPPTPRGTLTVVLGPIREVLPPYDVLKDEPYNSPRNVVDRSRRRDLADAREHEAAMPYAKRHMAMGHMAMGQTITRWDRM